MPPRFTWALTALAVLVVSRSASAHGVFGDPDSGKALYVLPGLVLNGGGALSGTKEGVLDGGIEVSVHRFVPGTSALTQLGYGALAQAQLGGILRNDRGEALDPGARLGLGVQGTWGLLGAQIGGMCRTSQGPFAGAAGPFTGVFVSLGIVSGGVQLDVPLASLGSGARFPVVLSGLVTLKWPVRILLD